MRTGIDVLEAEAFKPLSGLRVGLITNPTGITADFRSTIDVLHGADHVELAALFGPEHGVRGDAAAGEKITSGKDPATGVTVHSLYGDNRKPTPEMLAGLDALVYDIQDIGSRSYTYISTMTAAMEVAAEHDVTFVVLDRPNPLNGNRIEGRPLDLAFKSFVGYLPIPYVYGMTCGEVARMANGEGWLGEGRKCRLQVVAMQGWRRDMNFAETGLPWVAPSPHIPRSSTSLFYAATGIMGELRVVNEGVGYTLPFELAGAPFLDAAELARDLNDRRLAGVYFRALHYKPYYTAYKDQVCAGVQIHLTDPAQADLTGIQFHIMDYMRKRHPDRPLFGAKRDAMFDKVCGSDTVRQMFLDGQPVETIIRYWNSGRSEFMSRRAEYLLYK